MNEFLIEWAKGLDGNRKFWISVWGIIFPTVATTIISCVYMNISKLELPPHPPENLLPYMEAGYEQVLEKTPETKHEWPHYRVLWKKVKENPKDNE